MYKEEEINYDFQWIGYNVLIDNVIADCKSMKTLGATHIYIEVFPDGIYEKKALKLTEKEKLEKILSIAESIYMNDREKLISIKIICQE